MGYFWTIGMKRYTGSKVRDQMRYFPNYKSNQYLLRNKVPCPSEHQNRRVASGRFRFQPSSLRTKHCLTRHWYKWFQKLQQIEKLKRCLWENWTSDIPTHSCTRVALTFAKSLHMDYKMWRKRKPENITFLVTKAIFYKRKIVLSVSQRFWIVCCSCVAWSSCSGISS